MANDEKRWMTCPYNVRASVCVIERNTHRCHERAPAKDAAKVIVDCIHHAGWRVLFHTAMVKEKLCQRCKQCSGGPVTGAIGNPEQDPAIFHSQPAVDVASHLDHRAVTSCNIPSGKHQWLLGNQRLLRQARCRQIALKVSAPSFELVILPLQLPPHGAETKLGLDSRTQHCCIDWFCHKIICASLQTRDFALLASVRCQHNCRHLCNCLLLIRAKLF